MNNDQLDFIKEMLKSEGWRIVSELNKQNVADLRVMATQQKVSLEDRLWYSAQAQGREQAIDDITRLTE